MGKAMLVRARIAFIIKRVMRLLLLLEINEGYVMKKPIAFLVATILLGTSIPAFSFNLIKEDEAKLPAAAGSLETRGITRGPAVKLLSPDTSAGPVKGPFNLKVAFEARGGAKIDPASIKVVYLKATPVDLLERIKPGLTADGIQLAGAEVPPGEHQIQISLQDSEGRKASKIVSINAAK